MEGSEIRRRMTLSEQFSLLQPCNLRDLLMARDDDDDDDDDPNARRRGGRGTVTLAAVLASEKREFAADASGHGGRTLLDIICGEEEARSAAGSSGTTASWRSFKDLLRLRRAADAISASNLAFPVPPGPAADGPISDGRSEIPPRESAASPVVAARGEESGRLDRGPPADAAAAADEEQRTIRVSLMTLLELADGHGGDSGGGEVAVTAVRAVAEEEGGGEERHVCCVCMVRHKGAAFIPCGHTFCRVCSRELLLSRGICPLCNGPILDILDIF